ncbi:hypothetical protein L484_008898 [Morus notabilis]|uniref:DUF4378 domain-containing protein n=1 Tax=Morus notabilis TaxID=981085 RepID=W9R487_9ROSA|nr:uncharacterized protein LOC21392249 isoform X2 [Morus notabilis]EXB67881.1 hypothetical protein L484_008898 [Morus notabilis]
MERFRPNRSKIAGIADRSSADLLLFNEQAFAQGNRQVQNQRNLPKLASDSSSCSSDTADDDSFTFELGLRSSKRGIGTPMKKLLAKEMSKETESKRRSPSVIAKLMGLDGLPTQLPAYKEEKGMSENYLQTSGSAEKGQRSSRHYDYRSSSRKSSKDEQEFKDVFEVLETSKVASCSYPSQGVVNSNLTDAEIAFIKQKFMDAKRLSTDEKLQSSKEFHDALEILDSNKDLLLKFLQQPDLLFTKHLHDLQGSAPQLLCGRIEAMKASDAQMYESTHLDIKSARQVHKNRNVSSQKHHDRHSGHSNCYMAPSSLKAPNNQLEGKEESAILPTRIVVLKPNLGKVLHAANDVSSPCSSRPSISDCRKDMEIPILKNSNVELLGRRSFHGDGGLSGHKARESRELAKEIARQMRASFSNSSMRFSSFAYKGYAGDESSCSMSGNESANESEVMSMSSKYSFDWNNQSRPSSSRSTESSVTREAKKRLSERWRLNHRSLDMGSVSRGTTLGEMLAIPDNERIPVHFNTITDEKGFRNKFASDRPTGRVEPLGISSRDGWKDGCVGKLPRSRSLPSSSTVFGSAKSIMCREPIRDDRYVVPREAFMRERNKSPKNNLDDRSIIRNTRSRSTRSYLSHYIIRESCDMSPDTHTSQNQVKIKLEVNSPPVQKLEELESLASNVKDTTPVPETLVDVECEVEHGTTMSSEPLDKLIPELSTQPDACNTGNQEDLNLQEPPIESHDESSLPAKRSTHGLESPASSKEAEQPSPVSVLEVPFTDDLSSCSECFESLSADLQGLRMQLQLLKLESESYEEGPMLISSDEDVGEGSTRFSDAIGLYRYQQSWECGYMVDVLGHSGLNGADTDVFLASWHAPECPVSPLVFEELEKNYYDQASPPKSERRLLFDRINSGILEMCQQFTDPHPWVRSEATVMVPRWSKNGLQDGLRWLLASQEKNAKKCTTEKVLGKESQWLDLADDIDALGRWIEKLLLNDLVEELAAM